MGDLVEFVFPAFLGRRFLLARAYQQGEHLADPRHCITVMGQDTIGKVDVLTFNGNVVYRLSPPRQPHAFGVSNPRSDRRWSTAPAWCA